MSCHESGSITGHKKSSGEAPPHERSDQLRHKSRQYLTPGSLEDMKGQVNYSNSCVSGHFHEFRSKEL
jgi:hypothetical protein